jgi:hypothetical protein
VNDLDWTATPDGQSVLAVGYADRVELLCERRMTYFDEARAWTLCWTVAVGRWACSAGRHMSLTSSSTIPLAIADSVWLAGGALAVAAGHALALYAPPRGRTPAAETLFEHVAAHNGPLADYHPQMLLQLLLWGACVRRAQAPCR